MEPVQSEMNILSNGKNHDLGDEVGMSMKTQPEDDQWVFFLLIKSQMNGCPLVTTGEQHFNTEHALSLLVWKLHFFPLIMTSVTDVVSNIQYVFLHINPFVLNACLPFYCLLHLVDPYTEMALKQSGMSVEVCTKDFLTACLFLYIHEYRELTMWCKLLAAADIFTVIPETRN